MDNYMRSIIVLLALCSYPLWVFLYVRTLSSPAFQRFLETTFGTKAEKLITGFLLLFGLFAVIWRLFLDGHAYRTTSGLLKLLLDIFYFIPDQIMRLVGNSLV
jgi:hypothetical protein